ncbi:transposable element Tcb2 transposase [Trichonephila clavipes]|nr:transposable element Tcb2 transposase [Trichonephila clavipes]
MVWSAISYQVRSNLPQIECNLKSKWYNCEVLQPEVIPFLQDIPGAILQQYNTLPHVAKTFRDFYSTQHMHLLNWPAYSPDMSPIEPVWNLVGWCLNRNPRHIALKDVFLLHIQAIWKSLP